MSDRATRTALLLVLAVAAVLRFWALDHGLPFTMARPDEAEALVHTRGFPSGDLNPRWFVYPNLFFWLIWIWDTACLAVRGLFVATPGYVEALDGDLALLIHDGRILSALVGTATVLVVHRLGRRVGGPATGLAAAALLAVNFLHARDSHALKTDILLAGAVPICVALLARYRDTLDTRTAVHAGLAIGIATALKYPGCVLLVTAWYAASSRPGAGWRRVVPHPSLAILVGVAVLAFVAGCPYMLTDRARLSDTFTTSVMLVYGVRPAMLVGVGHDPLSLAIAFVRSRSFEYNLVIGLRHGAGLAFALVSPIAIVAALRRGTPSVLRCAAVTSVVYYLIISLSQVELARYLTPVMPLLALLVGWLVVSVSRLAGGPVARAATAVVLTALLGAESLASAIAHNRIAARTDTRVEATRWIAANVPSGSAVAILGSTYFPIADPQLPPTVRRVEVPLGETDFDRYGIDYVVTHEHLLPFSLVNDAQTRALSEHCTRLVEFSPFVGAPGGGFEILDAYYVPFYDFAPVVRPGPLVRVCRLEHAPHSR